MKTLAMVFSVALAVALAAEVAMVQPKDLAAQLQAKGAQPKIFHVGFPVQYRSKHIPGSVMLGAANTPDGIAALRAAVERLSRDADLVIYCGCCPWDHCPNMKPAMALLQEMGFTKARALYIPDNMAVNWYNLGYPTEEGTPAPPKK